MGEKLCQDGLFWGMCGHMQRAGWQCYSKDQNITLCADKVVGKCAVKGVKVGGMRGHMQRAGVQHLWAELGSQDEHGHECHLAQGSQYH